MKWLWNNVGWSKQLFDHEQTEQNKNWIVQTGGIIISNEFDRKVPLKMISHYMIDHHMIRLFATSSASLTAQFNLILIQTLFKHLFKHLPPFFFNWHLYFHCTSNTDKLFNKFAITNQVTELSHRPNFWSMMNHEPAVQLWCWQLN